MAGFTGSQSRGVRGARRAAVVALAGVTLALAACGSSNSGSGTTTTSPSGGGSSTTTTMGGNSTSTTSGSNSSAAKLAAIAAAVKKESKASFKLTYTTTSSSGKTMITLEQSPPKQRFVSGSSEFLFDGNSMYICEIGAHPGTCMKYPKGATNPMSAMMGIYTGSTALSAISSWRSMVSSGVMGYHVSYSTETFAGQSAQCVNWSYHGDSAKYCVTESGVLAYAGGTGANSSGSFELTSFSSSAPASDFALPKGATMTNMP